MARLNLLLLGVLVVCALALVSAQHRARTLYSELDRARTFAHTLDVEFGKLQLEASTWALHARIESVARRTLGMRVPDPRRVRAVRLGDAQAGGTTGAAQGATGAR